MYRNCAENDTATSTCTRRFLEDGQQSISYRVLTSADGTLRLEPITSPESARLFLNKTPQGAELYVYAGDASAGTPANAQPTPYSRTITLSQAP